jgi:hypothetical protein
MPEIKNHVNAEISVAGNRMLFIFAFSRPGIHFQAVHAFRRAFTDKGAYRYNDASWKELL